MQLYALDLEGKLVSALSAAKQQDFFCIECQQIVRVRGGTHRHMHFFHLTTPDSCHLHAKSMAHIQTQLHLLSILPSEEAALEHRFAEIKRIADVAWHARKLIFEIQCSPISPEEIRARNHDYATLGYYVVWILHDNRYNQKMISSAEHFLKGSTTYFTNIDQHGNGIIYDQFELIKKNKRHEALPPLPIDLSQPRLVESSAPALSTKLGKSRSKYWSCHFSGDLLDLEKGAANEHEIHDDNHSTTYLKRALAIEAEHCQPNMPWNEWPQVLFEKFVVRPYKLLFQIILESSCK